MPEILEGRFHPMHTDPKRVRAATRAILLLPVWLIFAFLLGQLAYLGGAWIAVNYLVR